MDPPLEKKSRLDPPWKKNPVSAPGYAMVTRDYLWYISEWNKGVYYKYSSVTIVYLFYIIRSQAMVYLPNLGDIPLSIFILTVLISKSGSYTMVLSSAHYVRSEYE